MQGGDTGWQFGESFCKVPLGAPERPLVITESRPLFTLRNGGSESVRLGSVQHQR